MINKMSTKNRVVWSEGLFIKPQHFQQMQRSLEHNIDSRIRGLKDNFYGLLELQINQDHLSFGKITIERAIGIMPDGTEFNVPIHDPAPTSLEITQTQAGNQIVYLAIADRSDSQVEVSNHNNTRYKNTAEPIRDLHTEMGDFSEISVAPVQLRLMLENEDRSAFSCIAIAKIKEKKSSGPITLYSDFIPCHLNSLNFSVLNNYLHELEGLVRTRSENIALRIGTPSQSGVADVSDFMMLQVLNMMHGELQYLTKANHLSPEDFYIFAVKYASHLFTFTSNDRLAPIFESYDHKHPDFSLKSSMELLRRALSTELDSKAMPIPIIPKAHGLSIAPLADKTLLKSAEFILAVRASLSNEDLRKYFTQQTKVASIEKIRDMVSLQLPAIPLLALPVTPRQLPYHADYIYFKLDRNSPAWQMLINSSGFAFHVAGDFPNLNMNFWAIRE